MEDSRKVRKRFYQCVLSLLLFCVLGSGISVWGYQTFSASYRRDVTLAQVAMQHLQTAETLMAKLPQNPLDVSTVNGAHHEFDAAFTNFSQLNDSLKALPAGSTFIPVYGTRVNAAQHLAPLAMDLSQAGSMGCDILQLFISKFHDPLKLQGPAFSMTDLTAVDQKFQQIKEAVNLAIEQANQLQPADLQFDPRLIKAFTTFHKAIPMLQAWVDDVEQLLRVAPTLLGIGTTANYLLEVLDPTELRPGGGFIGNYGIVTFSGSRLTSAHITDVDLLDNILHVAGKRIPYPEEYKWFTLVAPDSWSFRDSNLDADFPTSARNAELNYTREGGNVPVQGVIAITPTIIQQALKITGPISIPEYHETVTAQNLVDRIHYHQLAPSAYEGAATVPAPDGHSSLRKHFTAILSEHFIDQVRHLPTSLLPKFLQLLVNALHSKDIQIYLNQDSAEKLLQHYHFDAAIQTPASSSLFVVDANIGGNKANYSILSTLNDQVTLDEQGNAVHHTTLLYSWTAPGVEYGSPLYKDYIRVYVPSNSVLQAQQGWSPGGTSEAFGHRVWSGSFRLRQGQTSSITLLWTEPGSVKKDASGWHYQYLVQRQAGALRTLNLQILLPSCSGRPQVWGGLLLNTQHSATFTQFLYEDRNFEVDYAC